MVKSKATLSLDSYTYEEAKNTYDSVSQRVEELLEADLDVSETKDKKILKRKIEELQEEKEELESEKARIQKDLSNVESELSTARSTLKRLEQEEEEEQEQLSRFKEVFEKKDDWRKPEDIPDYWENQLDKPKQELFQIGDSVGE